MTTKKTNATNVTVKTPTQSAVEELRVLNAEAAAATSTQKEWITPELVSMVSTVAVNLITAATVVGWLDVTSAQEVTKAITAVITAVGTIGVNGMIVWRYLRGREAVKTEAMRAQYQYMETVAVERLRADGRSW